MDVLQNVRQSNRKTIYPDISLRGIGERKPKNNQDNSSLQQKRNKREIHYEK